MRRLRRPAVQPPTLASGSGHQQASSHRTAWDERAEVPSRFPDHWNEPDVRGSLYAFHGSACAYCQCDLPGNDRGDVEHFRPKSTYWWLAYDFGNYLLSCSRCNRRFKREKFPLPEGTLPVTYPDRAQLDQEPHLLLDPAGADTAVEQWFQVDFTKELYPVGPAPGLVAGSASRERVEKTIEFFRLNKTGLLVKERRQILDKAIKAIEPAQAGNEEKRLELMRLASRYRQHGFAVRQYLAAAAPELLPTSEDELLDLVIELVQTLEVVLKILGENPGDKVVNREKDEACWALAVLWKDPPVVEPAVLEDWLEKAGCRAAVAPYFGKLGGGG